MQGFGHLSHAHVLAEEFGAPAKLFAKDWVVRERDGQLAALLSGIIIIRLVSDVAKLLTHRLTAALQLCRPGSQTARPQVPLVARIVRRIDDPKPRFDELSRLSLGER